MLTKYKNGSDTAYTVACDDNRSMTSITKGSSVAFPEKIFADSPKRS